MDKGSMNPKRRWQMWLRLTLLAVVIYAAIVACGCLAKNDWAPTISTITLQTDQPRGVFVLPFTISRWLDLLIWPILIGLLVLEFTRHKVWRYQNETGYRAIAFIIGAFFGLVFGLILGLLSGVVVGLSIGLALGMICAMILGTVWGIFGEDDATTSTDTVKTLLMFGSYIGAGAGIMMIFAWSIWGLFLGLASGMLIVAPIPLSYGFIKLVRWAGKFTLARDQSEPPTAE